MSFRKKIQNKSVTTGSLLCLGLDIDITKTIFKSNYNISNDLYPILRDIVDATAEDVCCFKPQVAFFSAYAAEKSLEKVCNYISDKYSETPVILDAKRGDIGNTAKFYARECFIRYNADAVTINPYMGSDTIEPFLKYDDKGVFLLAKTSNPSSSELQEKLVDGLPLYQYLVKLYEARFGGKVDYVVGATDLNAVKFVLSNTESSMALLPGFGNQGAKISELDKFSENVMSRIIVNVSRSALYGDGKLRTPKAISEFLKLQKTGFNFR